MDKSEFLINEINLPNWFKYPDPFLKVVENNLVDLTPWYILSNEALEWRYSGMKERYLALSLVPFAARYDNDDVACWEKTNPDKVFIIHDFASEGWEKRNSYESFWDWFRIAIEDMIQYD